MYTIRVKKHNESYYYCVSDIHNIRLELDSDNKSVNVYETSNNSYIGSIEEIMQDRLDDFYEEYSKIYSESSEDK